MRHHDVVPLPWCGDILYSINLGFYSTVKTLSYFLLSASLSLSFVSHPRRILPPTFNFFALSTKRYDFYVIYVQIIEYLLVFNMYLLIRTRFRADFENLAFWFFTKSNQDVDVFGLSLLLSYSSSYPKQTLKSISVDYVWILARQFPETPTVGWPRRIVMVLDVVT